MKPELEALIRTVVLDRGFEIRVENFGGEVACTVTDPSDERGGCATLRGESGPNRSVEEALTEACTAARDDRYPQATGCGRGVLPMSKGGTTCILGKIHDGDCIDIRGNRSPN